MTHINISGITDIRICAHAEHPHKIEVSFKDGKKNMVSHIKEGEENAEH